MSPRRAFYFDLLERTGWTFVQAFCAFWIVTGDVDGPTLKAALVAGAISVGKSLVATNLPWTAPDSASSLPAEIDPPTGE
jgi:hypothetical protein